MAKKKKTSKKKTSKKTKPDVAPPSKVKMTGEEIREHDDLQNLLLDKKTGQIKKGSDPALVERYQQLNAKHRAEYEFPDNAKITGATEAAVLNVKGKRIIKTVKKHK